MEGDGHGATAVPDALEGLVDEATLARLRRARAGEDAPNRLRIATLAPGDVGVLEAAVVQVHPARPYARKRGGAGELVRVTLADASGEADLVLWDDEARHTRGGALVPGATVRLRGPQVKAGHRGGVELGLGSAVLETVPVPEAALCSATLQALGPTQVLEGPPPRFQAEATLSTPGGTVRAMLEGPVLLQARAAGLPCEVEGLAPHPALADWMLATPAARVVPSAPTGPATSDTLK
ncbi:MAG TPA: hypothetical protein VM286_02070 [Candidatus Thermoplasmatota archaeon]|nr:hypothetical protein [Candidatus Thermoplasmatota archaeon]